MVMVWSRVICSWLAGARDVVGDREQAMLSVDIDD
jgi:hypothetical protein